MENAGYFSIFRERWLVILLSAIIGFTIATATAENLEKTYQSSATLFLQVDAPSSGLNEQSQFSLSRIKSYVDLVSSPDLLDGVVSSLGLEMTSAELKKQLSAENPLSTVLLVVTAKADDPELAASIANAAAAGLSVKVDQLENSTPDSKYAIRLDVTLPAQAPSGPSSPNVPVIVGLGIIGGLAAGLIAAILIERLRPRVRTASDVRRITGLPLIAQLPRRFSSNGGGTGRVDNSLRTAASNLRAISRGHLPPVIALVPVGARPARPTTRLGLARGLASTGRAVILIESDVTAQRAARFPFPDSTVGLSEALSGTIDVSSALQTLTSEQFRVLPAGSPNAVPTEFVTERNIGRVMAAVAENVDIAVLQVQAYSEPLPLEAVAPVVRGAILVTSFSTTTARQLKRELSMLRILNVVPIGVIMTDVPALRQVSLLESWQAQDFVTISTEEDEAMPTSVAAKPRARSRTAASRARAKASAAAAAAQGSTPTTAHDDTDREIAGFLDFVDSDTPARAGDE